MRDCDVASGSRVVLARVVQERGPPYHFVIAPGLSHTVQDCETMPPVLAWHSGEYSVEVLAEYMPRFPHLCIAYPTEKRREELARSVDPPTYHALTEE